MTHTCRLTTDFAKNYCNQRLIVKVIVENVVMCFGGTQCSTRIYVRTGKAKDSNKCTVETALIGTFR